MFPKEWTIYLGANPTRTSDPQTDLLAQNTISMYWKMLEFLRAMATKRRTPTFHGLGGSFPEGDIMGPFNWLEKHYLHGISGIELPCIRCGMASLLVIPS